MSSVVEMWVGEMILASPGLNSLIEIETHLQRPPDERHGQIEVVLSGPLCQTNTHTHTHTPNFFVSFGSRLSRASERSLLSARHKGLRFCSPACSKPSATFTSISDSTPHTWKRGAGNGKDVYGPSDTLGCPSWGGCATSNSWKSQPQP